MISRTLLTRIALGCTALALVVVVLGVYVRLSDAGLGCPDWPGCYGELVAPSEGQRPEVAANYERPLEVAKAWKEMAHRYLAGILGLAILALALLSWRRRNIPGQPYRIAIAVVALVIFQAALGMWTVTLLLKPLIVVLHLLGGMTILGLLWWATLRQGQWWVHAGDGFRSDSLAPLRPWLVGAGVVLAVQIALGGWTSTNYAALACPDFPTCHGQWWPQADFSEGFVLWRGLGRDYEGGVLDGPARVAIHLAHRVGAVIAFLYIAAFAVRLLLAGRRAGATVLMLLLVQVSLGIANVLLGLPLPVAVMHNGVAALLLLSLITVGHQLWPPQTPMTGN